MPRESRNIVLIGAGNVAYHLGKALKRSGNHLLGVINRNEKKGERLAFDLGCPFLVGYKAIPEETDIVLLAVADDAIEEVAKQIFCPGKMVAHTSGTVAMSSLGDASDRLGVFYPLQTMHQSMGVNMSEVPLCIEANSKWGEGMLLELASCISDNVQLVNSDQRRTMHLAAVFACNFSNHLYALASDILQKDGLDISLLRPLIEKTAANIKNGDPRKLQTGPAIRGDKDVLDRHRSMLQNEDPKLLEFYEMFTQSILSQRIS